MGSLSAEMVFISLLVIMVIMGMVGLAIVWTMRGLATRVEVKDMELDIERKFELQSQKTGNQQGKLHARMDKLSEVAIKTNTGIEILLNDRNAARDAEAKAKANAEAINYLEQQSQS